jgi:hypothetical protein
MKERNANTQMKGKKNAEKHDCTGVHVYRSELKN